LKREHVILLVLNAAMLLGFGRAYMVRENYEFIIFVGIILLFIVIIAATINRVEYTLDALVGLTVWSGLHLAGGLIPVGDGRLYDTMLVRITDSYPILRYDQFVHIWGFGTATLIMFCLLKPMLRGARQRRIALDIVIVMAGMGVGALNEFVEFVVQESVPESGIGGYENTMLDLGADLAGALLALVYVRALHLKDVFTSRPDDAPEEDQASSSPNSSNQAS
jgi:putative membrane protein